MHSNQECEPIEYKDAVQKVNLVERNANPGGVHINLLRVSMHEENDIITLAKQIQLADRCVENVASGKLKLILEQIRFLQAQAKNILEETYESKSLHNAACNFKKIPGHIYHLYENNNSGQWFFSMLSPEEWGELGHHKFIESYRLENDLTWTSIKDCQEKDKSLNWAKNMLSLGKAKINLSLDGGIS